MRCCLYSEFILGVSSFKMFGRYIEKIGHFLWRQEPYVYKRVINKILKFSVF